MGDLEMKDAPTTQPEAEKEQAKELSPSALLANDIKTCIELIERGVSTKEVRFVTRALRMLAGFRTKLSANLLRDAVSQCFVDGNQSKNSLIDLLPIVDASMDENDDTPSLPQRAASLPEVEMFIHITVLIYLLDAKILNKAIACGDLLVGRLQQFNRRMLDPISAKAWFYFSLSYEAASRSMLIRGTLLSAYRTACLHHNEPAQATLINLLLRNYVTHNHYHLADKLVGKAVLPDSIDNSQLARYHYYVGRLRSVQLDYTIAHQCLMQAIRKAPTHSAKGFRAEVHKVLCVVQLLMGEIPDRDMFYQPGIASQLKPYFSITQAVRGGDLAVFQSEMEKNKAAFVKDKTFTLIVRLRQNVIKTALRKISIAYSKISLQDVCNRLGLDDVRDCEYVVAKAISDGVIDAKIDHEGGFMSSLDTLDVYSTHEPHAAFHKRIEFCLKVRNDAIKAMRYPEDSNKGEIETVEQRRERLAAEAELAEELAEEDDDENF